MVILLKLMSILFAVLLIVVISSLLADSHTIHGNKNHAVAEPRTKMELITSSNYTKVKNHQKRQSYYNQVTNKGTVSNKKPYRDSKHDYIDENDRDNYLVNERQQQMHQKPVYDDNEQNFSSSTFPIYRSSYHGGGGGGMGAHPFFGAGGFPEMGFGFGGPGGVSGAPGFGPGPLNPVAGVGGHALGHSFSILDPLFLMITLSFILFLVHSILGLVDRVRLPVIRARMDDGPTIDSEMLDQMLFELREAFNKHKNEEKVQKIKIGVQKAQATGNKYTNQ